MIRKSYHWISVTLQLLYTTWFPGALVLFKQDNKPPPSIHTVPDLFSTGPQRATRQGGHHHAAFLHASLRESASKWWGSNHCSNDDGKMKIAKKSFTFLENQMVFSVQHYITLYKPILEQKRISCNFRFHFGFLNLSMLNKYVCSLFVRCFSPANL